MNSEPSASPYHVLIVEDHALVAKFYRLALERAGGFSCQVTEDVNEILATVEAGRAHLVILDISLRGAQWQGQAIDGVQLAQLLKQKARGRLPILLATAHAMAGDRERLLETSGADAYLQKPIYDSHQLVEAVRGLLDRS